MSSSKILATHKSLTAVNQVHTQSVKIKVNIIQAMKENGFSLCRVLATVQQKDNRAKAKLNIFYQLTVLRIHRTLESSNRN